MIKKIFIPQCCIRSPPGILVGVVNPALASTYVVAVAHFPITPKQLNNYLRKFNKSDANNKEGNWELLPLGTWLGCGEYEEKDKDFHQFLPQLFGQKNWTCLKANRSEDGDLVVNVQELISQSGKGDILSGNEFEKTVSDSLAIIYNQKELWESDFIPKSSPDSNLTTGLLENLCEVVSACRNGILSYDAGLNLEEENLKMTHCCVEREMSIVIFMLWIFTTFFLQLLHTFIFYAKRSYKKYCQVFNPLFKFLHSLLQLSSFSSHAIKKYENFQKSILQLHEMHGEPSTQREELNRRNKNVLSSFFMDILFGIVLLIILYYHELLLFNKTTKELFLPSVEYIAGQVEELIEWLMGIPAGLKLNHPLNQFLGHFFLFHVRLWLEYSRLMMDLIPHLMTYCLLSSCLGFSFFLSIISDTVSTLSFHVYCFYVYAGRLYGMQIKGLTSLWRLFRGKKWNPLRQRVDSLEESGADQLFVGTLFFTVLLFLLPTTALYYAIFMMLRVAVLAIQVFLSGLIFIFSEYPWYSTGLRFFRPHKFVKSLSCKWVSPVIQPHDEIEESEFTIRHNQDEALVLHISTHSQGYGEVIQGGLRQGCPDPLYFTHPKNLLRKIVSGDLIKWS